MFDKYIFSYKNFYKIIDTPFILRKNNNIVWCIKLSKIIFTGKVYKLRKFKLILVPKVNISHNSFIELKNMFIKRKKKDKVWNFFSNFNKIPRIIINSRKINVYTKRGFWENKFFLKEKKKIKNN